MLVEMFPLIASAMAVLCFAVGSREAANKRAARWPIGTRATLLLGKDFEATLLNGPRGPDRPV
jgi:hypothetical protein